MQLMSKGDFATHIGVSAGRVSQYIAEGIIDRSALEGEGRSARVRVAIATDQIRTRRHVGQALGNGLQTRLSEPAPASVADASQARPATEAAPSATPVRSDDVAYQIQQERLESERRKNRLAAQDEAVRQGKLVHAEHVRAEMMRLGRQIHEENAAMLADFASAISGQYQLPQRDVLHLLRRVRAEKLAAASERARERAGGLAATVDVEVDEAEETLPA